jgi:hypothetical protein
MQICSTCKKVLSPKEYYRNYKYYKTCNHCYANNDKYKDKYAHKRKIELEARMMTHLKNMYRAIKSGDRYRREDCAKMIHKFVTYRKGMAGETVTERLLLDISEAWKNKDKASMTKTVYGLLDFIEKVPQN